MLLWWVDYGFSFFLEVQQPFVNEVLDGMPETEALIRAMPEAPHMEFTP